jgi:hypothetical protein
MLRDRLMVSGRRESPVFSAAIGADEERVRIAAVSTLGGLLYRSDLVTSTGEARSEPSHSHTGFSGPIVSFAPTGGLVVLDEGSSLSPLEVSFMETALTTRWRRQISPLGGTEKGLVVSENESSCLTQPDDGHGTRLWPRGETLGDRSSLRPPVAARRPSERGRRAVLADGPNKRLLRYGERTAKWWTASPVRRRTDLSVVDVAADAEGLAVV